MRRWVAAALIAAGVAALLARGACAADGGPAPRVAPKPEYSAGDLALLYEFSERMEALPLEGRDAASLELLGRAAERAESPRLRRALLFSLGLVHAKTGRMKDAEAAFLAATEVPGRRDSNYYDSLKKLVEIARETRDSVALAAAVELCLKAVRTAERPRADVEGMLEVCRTCGTPRSLAAGAQICREELAGRDLPPSRRVELTRWAFYFFTLSGRPSETDEAVRTLAILANGDDPAWRPLRREAFSCAVDAASGMSVNDFALERYELMLWTEEAFPDFSDTPNFLNNLAFSATFAGLEGDAIRHRRRLVERFPDDAAAPGQLVILGSDYYESGFHRRAAAAYRRAIGHPKATDEARRRAEEGLAIAERRPKVIVVKEPGKTTFKTLPEDAR